MADTYTKIYIHIVFSVAFREAVINESWEERLYQYITGIVQKNGHKMMQINGMPDHIHLLVGMTTNQSISELVRLVKQGSSYWINKNRLTRYRFKWQSGYGAFSCQSSNLQGVLNYIKNQKIHHSKTRFLDEYKRFLNENAIEFNSDYLFKEL